MTTRRTKTVQEHVQIARSFLENAAREFDAGDQLQGSEKLWGAATHAVTALAKQRGWRFGKSNARSRAVERLAEEEEDPSWSAGYLAAEQFHANFYHDFMEDYTIDRARPIVGEFVRRVLAKVESSAT